MGVITLPYSMEQDRLNQIKANSVHVDANFDALLNATNNKLEKDGSIIPTADLSMGSHKITNLGAATADGDAVSQGWVNDKLSLKANLASPTFTGEPKAPTPTAGDNSTKIATTAFVNTVVGLNVPTGVILPFGGTTAPTGFLICDGSAISRTTYANLFAAIGTTYGPGDGSTTFNLPNGKIPVGTSVPVVRSGDTTADVPTFVSVDDISGTPDFFNAAAVGSVHGVAVLSRNTNIGNGLMFANTGLKTDLTNTTTAIIKY